MAKKKAVTKKAVAKKVEKIVEVIKPEVKPAPSIEVKLISPKAVVPPLSEEGAYGWDLIATDLSVQHGKGPNSVSSFKYSLGISVKIPKGYIGLLVPLKSLQATKMTLPHSMEVISTDNELTIAFTGPKEAQNYALGRNVAQLIVLPAAGLGLTEIK